MVMLLRPIILVALVVTSITPTATMAQSRSALINEWQNSDRNCRGLNGGDARSEAACAAREIYDKRLRALGWCYIYEGYRTRPWHKCAVGEQ